MFSFSEIEVARFSSLPPHGFCGLMRAMPKDAPPSPRTAARRERQKIRRIERGSHPLTILAYMRRCEERWVWLCDRLLQEYYNVHWWFFTTCRSATRRDLCSLVNLESPKASRDFGVRGQGLVGVSWLFHIRLFCLVRMWIRRCDLPSLRLPR